MNRQAEGVVVKNEYNLVNPVDDSVVHKQFISNYWDGIWNSDGRLAYLLYQDKGLLAYSFLLHGQWHS